MIACCSLRLVVDGAVLVEPDVAVRVDQPRDDPALGHGLGTGLRLVGDQPVDDVQVTRLAVGQDRAPESLCSHAGDAIAGQIRPIDLTDSTAAKLG